MDERMIPTKANLIKAKSLLQFSNKGYELLDKKRNVLIREMMSLVERAKEVQGEIDETFSVAYEALLIARVSLGTANLNEIALSIPKDEDYDILQKSVMGIEIPKVNYKRTKSDMSYGLYRTSAAFDVAIEKFTKVRYFTYELAEIENAIYKLAVEINKTKKRANALEKIQIPKYKETVKNIEEVLEEKEREDFVRLKKVKSRKDNYT